MPNAVIYNVTTAVSPFIEKEWLIWMSDIHIPEVLGTGCFEKHQLVKLLDTDELEHATYAVQYYASDKSSYEKYISLFSVALRKAVKVKWGENAVSFQTLMSIID